MCLLIFPYFYSRYSWNNSLNSESVPSPTTSLIISEVPHSISNLNVPADSLKNNFESVPSLTTSHIISEDPRSIPVLNVPTDPLKCSSESIAFIHSGHTYPVMVLVQKCQVPPFGYYSSNCSSLRRDAIHKWRIICTLLSPKFALNFRDAVLLTMNIFLTLTREGIGTH